MTSAALDWDQARGRLRAAEQSLAAALAEDPVRTAAVWRERAVRLARPPSSAPSQGPLPVMVFRLAAELHAVELKDLAEVLPLAQCTPIPGARSHFTGVVNIRGELLPILDLAQFLGIPRPDPLDTAFVLLLRRQGRELGLKIDRIERIAEIRPDELTIASGAHTRGIAAGMITLLSVDAILAEIFSGANEEKTLTA